MGSTTGIAWTDATFNPWHGCTRVSPACEKCYAEAFSKRTGFNVWGVQADRRKFGDKHWNDPVRWNKAAEKAGQRMRVFCASMADVFEDRHDLDDDRERLWALIEATPWLDWQLLTKRPENIVTMLPDAWLKEPRPNVWLGTTCENQKYAEIRLPHLLAVNAAVHFVSYEPALGPADFTPWMKMFRNDHIVDPTGLAYQTVDWLIAGGESGPGHRPPDLDWFRAVREQCRVTGTAFFFKQVGGLRPTDGGDLLDGVQIKEFPVAALDMNKIA
jgi:protein gp37